MATLRDIVATAFRWANIIEAEDEPEAHEAVQGLEILNDMFYEMEVDGYVFTLPIVPPSTERGEYSHAGWKLEDDFPFEEGYVGGIKALLSVQLSELHGQPSPPHVVQKAGAGRARLINNFLPFQAMRSETPLQRVGRSGVGDSRRNYGAG